MTVVGIEEVAERLSALAEELADLEFDRLREAVVVAREQGEPDGELVAEVKRITRARTSVEKAATLLRPPVAD